VRSTPATTKASGRGSSASRAPLPPSRAKAETLVRASPSRAKVETPVQAPPSRAKVKTPCPAAGTTHRLPLLARGAHEATLAPVALWRPRKRTESGAAPGMATNPGVPRTHLHPGDTLRSLLAPRSRLTLREGKKTQNLDGCPFRILLPSSTLHPSPRDAWPCARPLKPSKGLPRHWVAKEVVGAGLEQWPRGVPVRKQREEEGRRGVKCLTLLSVSQ